VKSGNPEKSRFARKGQGAGNLRDKGRRKPARQRAQETCATKEQVCSKRAGKLLNKRAGNLLNKRAGLLEKSRFAREQCLSFSLSSR
jgi:hypothetical protein